VSASARIHRRTRRALPFTVSLALLAGCGALPVKDPRETSIAFARAAERGDAATLYAMLSPSAQRALSRADVARLVADEKVELGDAARSLESPNAQAHIAARLRFADGEEVALGASGGRFTVTSGGTLPGGAPTPETALDELRRAIARRSYHALLRLLSPSTRSAIEQDLRTLVLGLEHPESLLIHTNGDVASVVVPGGHRVTMKREAGIWHVEDFD